MKALKTLKEIFYFRFIRQLISGFFESYIYRHLALLPFSILLEEVSELYFFLCSFKKLFVSISTHQIGTNWQIVLAEILQVAAMQTHVCAKFFKTVQNLDLLMQIKKS